MTTHAKVRCQSVPVHYETSLTVERQMVRANIAGTEGAAYQKLRDLRDLLPRLVECFHVSASPERLVWFLAPLDAAVDRQPVPLLNDASLLEQETDGDEDTAWEKVRVARDAWIANPNTETARAYAEAKAFYTRIAHRYIARLTLKLRALKGSAQ